jgi:hypothetical protein
VGRPTLTLLRLLRSLTLLVSCWISATWSASRFCSFSFSASVSNSVRASCSDSRSGWPLGVFFSMSCQPERAKTGTPHMQTPPDLGSKPRPSHGLHRPGLKGTAYSWDRRYWTWNKALRNG